MAQKTISKVRPIIKLIPSLVWMFVIFHFSNNPTVGFMPSSAFRVFTLKCFHMVEYAILFILLFYFYKNYKYALVTTYLYAMTDELHQTFVTGREGCLRDTFIDLFGACLAFIFVKIISRRFPKVFNYFILN